MGSGRLQGFYGGEGGFLFQKNKRTDENDNVSQDEVGLGFFLQVFVGSEYFIAPKLSLGGQFSYGGSLLSSVNNETNSSTTVISVDLDNLGGAILLTFHF